MSDTLNIFISHKDEYETAARTIKGILSRLGGNSVKCFISEEIPAGDDWYQWIGDRLAESNVLLLLFTEPSASWDWCLYEAGLFQRIGGNDFRRVICLHSPQSDPPRPLKHLQAVATEADKVKQFLKDLFGGTALTGRAAPINEYFAQDNDAVTREAFAVCSVFNPVSRRKVHFNKFIELHVERPNEITAASIPGDATVRSNAVSLSVFGLTEGTWQWKDIEAQVRAQPDARWVDQLTDAVCKASSGHLFPPVQAMCRGSDGETYRPVLRRADFNSDASMTFFVAFVEEVSGQVGDLPQPLATMMTALSMGTRFRFEAIENGLESLRAAGNGAADTACESIKQSILNIESEAASRGAELSEKSLKALFANPQHKTQVEDIYSRWYDIRRELFDAIGRHDVATVKNTVFALRELNASFMTLASRRYHELVTEHMAAKTRDAAPGQWRGRKTAARQLVSPLVAPALAGMAAPN